MSTPVDREDYPYSLDIPTRWMDNDIYGHVNNVVYYSYFDTVINTVLIEDGGLDIHGATVIGVCADSQCRFLKPMAFPQTVEARLRVGHLGRTSVRYEVGLFIKGEPGVAAHGHFVHVFVERPAMQPVPIPERIRHALERLRP